jgi:hypothetical protein
LRLRLGHGLYTNLLRMHLLRMHLIRCRIALLAWRLSSATSVCGLKLLVYEALSY